ncbi:lyase family protein [Enterobacter hormaechei]
MTMHRREKDFMGAIDVPADKLWGAQTQRSLEHFRISTEKMPVSLIQALALTKRAAAKVNQDWACWMPIKPPPSSMPPTKCWRANIPTDSLAIWQTGSGTQSNVNMNEVLANRASGLLGGVRGMERRFTER